MIMKKYIKSVGVFCISVLAMLSCEKHEPFFFQGDDIVYFDVNEVESNQQLDSIVENFAFEYRVDRDTIIKKIPLKIQGHTARFDRTVNLVVAKNENITAAVEGEHFKLPESIVIPADSISAEVSVMIFPLKDLDNDGEPDLYKDTYYFNLKLQPNENFEVNLSGAEKVKPSNNGTRFIRYDDFWMGFSAIIKKPEAWEGSGAEERLGTYSFKKMRLYALVNEEPLESWQGVEDIDADDMPSFWDRDLRNGTDKLKQYLQEQKDAGNTIYEEDGTTEMVIP